MRVILTGGGSGGHIYPALAIGDKIKEMDPDTEFLYIGNRLGIEKKVVPPAGYDFEMVEARWFRRSIPELMKTGIVTLHGEHQAYRLMKRFRPDVVIGTGGFIVVPVILAGHRYGARCYLHEQNAFPGVANRFLEKKVDRVFLGFEEASSYFKQPEKHLVVGNPVREAFYQADRDTARKTIGAKDGEFVVFGFAGSQGATIMNQTFYELMKRLSGRPGIRMIFTIGSRHAKLFQEQMAKDGTEFADNIVIRSYINDMENYLAGADLVISRAGALSIAETCVCGTPMILVPSPNVPGDHQRINAHAVAERGGAVLLEESKFDAVHAEAVIEQLWKEPGKREEMAARAKACAPQDAARKIWEAIRNG